MEQKGLSKFAENAIAFGIAAAIIIGIIAAFGWTSVNAWVQEPLHWKEPEGVNITYLGSDLGTWGFNLRFSADNTTDTDITEYNFIVEIGDSTFEVYESFPTLKAHSTTQFSHNARESGYGAPVQSDYDKFVNDRFSTSDATIKVKRLYSHDDKVLSNNGWIKNFIIIAISFVFGLIGFQSKIGSPILRILFKTLGMPGILLVFGVMVVVSLSGRGGTSSYSGSSSADNAARQRANERYKRAAQHKAGYEMHGNTREAARAQREMDEAMTDMITGAGNSDTKKRYQQYASWEAGAKMTGNQREAARSQAAKEKALADIITDAAKDK